MKLPPFIHSVYFLIPMMVWQAQELGTGDEEMSEVQLKLRILQSSRQRSK